MNSNVLKFLKNKYTSNPKSIDQLFISAFVRVNNIVVKNNILIKSYINDFSVSQPNKLNEFIGILKENNIKLDFEDLINLFEFVVSPADKIVNGAVYTPLYIRNYITTTVMEKYNSDFKTIKVTDISCGCGGFLFNITEQLRLKGLSFTAIYANNIFGLDIQNYSITRTKLLLTLLAIYNGEDKKRFKFNLFVGDALIFDWKGVIKRFKGFNIILGNPPYVRLRNLPDKTRKLLKNWEVCKTGLTDLYIPFFQIAIENLSNDGVLGYITMNSFFKSLNGRALREYFHNKSLYFNIIDFGSEQIFKSKNTYTCICFIQNIKALFLGYSSLSSRSLNSNIKYNNIKYKDLDSFSGWNLRSNEIIQKIESTGTPFGKIYRTRHGIATLKNRIYIFQPIEEDEKYYYKEYENSIYPIEKNICKDIVNSNKLGSEEGTNLVKEVIIFPYSSDVKPKLICEKYFKYNYPCAYKYLAQQKETLAKRDGEKGNYEKWYAFGRTQSLERVQNKLFFPKISNKPPKCVISSNSDLFYYNGQAIIGHSIEELIIIKKIMQSRIFWYYIKNTSKPYSSEYYSLNGNYINNFGICDFNESELDYLKKENEQTKLDIFLEIKYGIQVS